MTDRTGHGSDCSVTHSSSVMTAASRTINKTASTVLHKYSRLLAIWKSNREGGVTMLEMKSNTDSSNSLGKPG